MKRVSASRESQNENGVCVLVARENHRNQFLANVGLDLTDQWLGSRLFTNVGLTRTKPRSTLGYLPTHGLNI
jgi:hypothetical protein